MREQTREFVMYAAASAAALLVDVGSLGLLVGWAGWQYLAAATVSFALGGAFLYFVSVNFVFGFRRISNRALELPLFLALGIAGLIVNTAVMFIAVEKLHLHYLVAKVAAAGCTFTINFLLRRNLLFSRLAQAQ